MSACIQASFVAPRVAMVRIPLLARHPPPSARYGFSDAVRGERFQRLFVAAAAAGGLLLDGCAEIELPPRASAWLDHGKRRAASAGSRWSAVDPLHGGSFSPLRDLTLTVWLHAR
jgi:hypothetical protein